MDIEELNEEAYRKQKALDDHFLHLLHFLHHINVHRFPNLGRVGNIFP